MSSGFSEKSDFFGGSERQEEVFEPFGNAGGAGNVGVQAVFGVKIALRFDLRVDVCVGVEVEHRDGIAGGHLFDGADVLAEAGNVRAFGLLFHGAVHGRHENDGGGRIFFHERAHQKMESAVKGVGGAVVRGAEGSVAVAEIVGPAEHDNEVGVGVHFVNTGAEIEVPARVGRGGLLAGDAGAANAVAAGLGHAGMLFENVPVGISDVWNAGAFGNAVAEKVCFDTLQFHSLPPKKRICTYHYRTNRAESQSFSANSLEKRTAFCYNLNRDEIRGRKEGSEMKRNAETETVVHPLEPIFSERSEILILGSFPSVRSREAAFYYGNPQNRFWQMLADVFGEPLPADNRARRALVLDHGLALWDVIASCRIRGSADSAIADVTPNDLSRVLAFAPIRRVLLNGKTAEKYFRKYHADLALPVVTLPSTSPANAAWSLGNLTDVWRAALLK